MLCSPVDARDLTSLQGEFWLDYQPMGQSGPLPAPTKDEAIKTLLEEARLYFSAMIFGYDFSWRPADKERQAEESFSMVPRGQIPWGDSDMEFREMRYDDASLYLRVRYFTKPFEQSRLEAWANTHLMDSGGTGRASYYQGAKNKLVAFQDACKEAIKAAARGMTLNRPAMVEGYFILADLPRFMVLEGSYQSSVKLRLELTGLDGYKTY